MALRGGGKGKGKGKGKSKTKEELGLSQESQLDDTQDFEQGNGSSDDDVFLDAADAGASDGDGEGVLDAMARFRGEHKKECKFIIVTGERTRKKNRRVFFPPKYTLFQHSALLLAGAHVYLQPRFLFGAPTCNRGGLLHSAVSCIAVVVNCSLKCGSTAVHCCLRRTQVSRSPCSW